MTGKGLIYARTLQQFKVPIPIFLYFSPLAILCIRFKDRLTIFYVPMRVIIVAET